MLEGLEELVGAWELRSCTTTRPGGEREFLYGHSPHGVILYTPDGWMSCHMACGEADLGKPGITQYSSYEGPVVMRAADKVVEHHVRLSTNDWMPGTIQERAYAVDGDTLRLSAQLNGNHIEVIWSREDVAPERRKLNR